MANRVHFILTISFSVLFSLSSLGLFLGRSGQTGAELSLLGLILNQLIWMFRLRLPLLKGIALSVAFLLSVVLYQARFGEKTPFRLSEGESMKLGHQSLTLDRIDADAGAIWVRYQADQKRGAQQIRFRHPVSLGDMRVHLLELIGKRSTSAKLQAVRTGKNFEQPFILSAGQVKRLGGVEVEIASIYPDVEGHGPAVQLKYRESKKPAQQFWLFSRYPGFDAYQRPKAVLNFEVRDVDLGLSARLSGGRYPGLILVPILALLSLVLWILFLGDPEEGIYLKPKDRVLWGLVSGVGLAIAYFGFKFLGPWGMKEGGVFYFGGVGLACLAVAAWICGGIVAVAQRPSGIRYRFIQLGFLMGWGGYLSFGAGSFLLKGEFWGIYGFDAVLLILLIWYGGVLYRERSERFRAV